MSYLFGNKFVSILVLASLGIVASTSRAEEDAWAHLEKIRNDLAARPVLKSGGFVIEVQTGDRRDGDDPNLTGHRKIELDLDGDNQLIRYYDQVSIPDSVLRKNHSAELKLHDAHLVTAKHCIDYKVDNNSLSVYPIKEKRPRKYNPCVDTIGYYIDDGSNIVDTLGGLKDRKDKFNLRVKNVGVDKVQVCLDGKSPRDRGFARMVFDVKTVTKLVSWEEGEINTGDGRYYMQGNIYWDQTSDGIWYMKKIEQYRKDLFYGEANGLLMPNFRVSNTRSVMTVKVNSSVIFEPGHFSIKNMGIVHNPKALFIVTDHQTKTFIAIKPDEFPKIDLDKLIEQTPFLKPYIPEGMSRP